MAFEFFFIVFSSPFIFTLVYSKSLLSISSSLSPIEILFLFIFFVILLFVVLVLLLFLRLIPLLFIFNKIESVKFCINIGLFKAFAITLLNCAFLLSFCWLLMLKGFRLNVLSVI